MRMQHWQAPCRMRCVCVYALFTSLSRWDSSLFLCFSVNFSLSPPSVCLSCSCSRFEHGFNFAKANNCEGRHGVAHPKLNGRWMTSTMKSVFHSVVFNASWKLNAFSQSSLSSLCQFHEHLRQIREIHGETKRNNTRMWWRKKKRTKMKMATEHWEW